MAQASNLQKFTIQALGAAAIDFPVLPEADTYDVGFKIITRSMRDMHATMRQFPVAQQDVIKGRFTCLDSTAAQLYGYIRDAVLNSKTFFNINYYSPGTGSTGKTGWFYGLFYISAETHVKLLTPVIGGYIQFELEFIEVDGVKLDRNGNYN
jgi:hypothetical protein